MTTLTLPLTLTFLSDWHAGSGYGRPGDVDRLVRRDEDGLPYVPASTLWGLWRDAAESLCQGLEVSKGLHLEPWLDFLFGSQPAIDKQAQRVPVPAGLRLGPARLDPQLRRVLRAHPLLAQSTTSVLPAVSMDPATGAAAENKLFFTEYALPEASLQAEATLTVESASSDFARDLLAAAAEGIQALGADRRRGRGRCRVRLANPQVPDATDHFFSRWVAGGPPPAAPQAPVVSDPLGPASTNSAAAVDDGVWSAWSMALDLREPLIVHARTLGNVVQTLDHVPGSLLLPLVARRLAGQGVDVFGALSKGELRVCHAFPSSGGVRLVVAPLTLFQEKNGPRLRLGRNGSDAIQWKQVRARYLDPTSQRGSVALHAIVPVLETHNVIQDDVQRPTSEVGGVFTYQAIPAGTRLQARLQARQGGVAERVLRSLFHEHKVEQTRMGRAHHSDYGAVSWQVTSSALPSAGQGGRVLRLWLVSPLLLRGATLRPSTDPRWLARLLALRLGTSVTFRPEESAVRTVMAFPLLSRIRAYRE